MTGRTVGLTRLLGCWPSAPEQLFDGEADIPRNFAQECRRDVSRSMKGNGCGSPISMSELLVRSTLTDLSKPKAFKQYDYLARL